MPSRYSTNEAFCLSTAYLQALNLVAVLPLMKLLMIAPSLPCVDQECVSSESGIENGDYV